MASDEVWFQDDAGIQVYRERQDGGPDDLGTHGVVVRIPDAGSGKEDPIWGIYRAVPWSVSGRSRVIPAGAFARQDTAGYVKLRTVDREYFYNRKEKICHDRAGNIKKVAG